MVGGVTGAGKTYIFALVRDVTETENLKAHLSKLAMTDELTAIYNRRAWLGCLDKEFSRAKRNHENLSVLMMDIDMAGSLAERLRQAIEDTFIEHDDITIKFTVSVGVAAFDNENITPATLISYADRALYRAKESGRNRVVLYD